VWLIRKPQCKKYFGVEFEHWHHGTKQYISSQGAGFAQRNEMDEMGSLMKMFLIVMASAVGVATAAVAADFPARQPPPPTPVVGKAPIGKGPIGKGPIGKGPIGKGPIGKGPVVAPGPIVTRG
jgi:hypothetical protein